LALQEAHEMLEKKPLAPAQLITELAAEMRIANLDKETSTKWTSVLKECLRSLLETEGTNVTEVLYSHRASEKHEFLLDIVVWDRSDGEGVTLAVESEWIQNVEAVAEDFWKLLVMKAPLKLMIFASPEKSVRFSQEAIGQN
jgi:hypothetical protein